MLYLEKNKSAGAIDSGLSFRIAEGEALVEWWSTCPFHEIFVERQICEGIDSAAIRCWLDVLDGVKDQAATKSKLVLENNQGCVMLTFGRTFLEPKSVRLCGADQVALKQLLLNVVESSEYDALVQPIMT